MDIYLLSILSLFLCHLTNAQAGHAAFCFLTHKLLPETLELAQEFAQDGLLYGLEIFIMIDDNNFDVSNINTSSNLRLLQIPNELCMQHNYRDATTYNGSNITSWDKALFYFGVLNKNYSFIWLSEDDVFYPSVQAFISVHELYSNTSDLISSDFPFNLLGDTSASHWKMVNGQFIPPWAKSMVNIIGLSRRLLTAATDYIQWLGRIPFHEYLFHTLAIQLNYTIVIPTELSTNVFKAPYYFQDIKKHPNNIWHPYIDIKIQKQWRKGLAKKNLINNTHIVLTNIELICHGNRRLAAIGEHLKSLLSKFIICKSKFSADTRRSLRQRFLNLAEQCQKRHIPNKIVAIAKRLAEHAYRLPEPPAEVLVPKKSEHHLKLETALEENKKSIYELPWNSSSLIKLRNETADLIKRLTVEIQREYKERKEPKLTSKLSSLSFSSITADYKSILLFSNEPMNAKMKKNSYILSDPHIIQMRNLFENNIEIVLLILFTFGVLFKRRKNICRRIFH